MTVVWSYRLWKPSNSYDASRYRISGTSKLPLSYNTHTRSPFSAPDYLMLSWCDDISTTILCRLLSGGYLKTLSIGCPQAPARGIEEVIVTAGTRERSLESLKIYGATGGARLSLSLSSSTMRSAPLPEYPHHRALELSDTVVADVAKSLPRIREINNDLGFSNEPIPW